MKKINFEELWSEAYDDDGNTVWKLPSPYTDGDGSPVFWFKIRQKLLGDEIFYVDSSDKELKDGIVDGWWSLSEAKADIEEKYVEILNSCADELSARRDEGVELSVCVYPNVEEWSCTHSTRILEEIENFLLLFKEKYNRRPIVEAFKVGVEIPWYDRSVMGLQMVAERDWTIDNYQIILKLK